MQEAPQMASYARHVFICTGQYCDPGRRAEALYQQLGQLLGDLSRYDNPQRVKRGMTSCLGVCVAGPIMVVYPEGVWYHHVDERLLARVVEEHLEQGNPVQEHIFHWLDPDGETSFGESHSIR